MLEDVKHEKYKGYDIRSSPCETGQGWKIRIDLPFPPTTEHPMREYLDDQIYPTLNEAHQAGFEWGRKLLDEQSRKGELGNHKQH